MSALNWRRNILPCVLVPVGLIILFVWVPSSATFAQDAANVASLRVVRAIDTNDLGLLNPAGLAYSFKADLFFILEVSSTTQANIATMTPSESLVAMDRVDVSLIDPINLAFDNFFNRLVLFDSATNELVEIRTRVDGHLNASPEAITRYQVGPLDLQGPRGMTFDPVNGHLYILDSAALQLVRIEPDAAGGFDGAAALIEGRVSWVDLTPIGLVEPRGLALNPNNGHIYLVSPAHQSVIELITTGQVTTILRLPPFEFIDPQGLVFCRARNCAP